jgi:hypothetical protein
MWGFLYRSTVGASWDVARGKIALRKLLRSWKAAAVLPLVQLGVAKDFWLPFEWYLHVEHGIPTTYYVIPFKRRVGDNVAAHHANRRASAYDIADIPEWIATLMTNGCEVGVHGIDAWHSAQTGREELQRVRAVTGDSAVGIRMHWLLRDKHTPQVLEEAGYSYDSTVGYNETVGFRAGTTQVYLPPGNRTLLELPIHVQDSALFYPQRLDLAEAEAWGLCERIIDGVKEHGGVLTLLWHDRSHGPERFWGDFYERLLGRLKALNVWIASAREVVDWFRSRREVVFNRTELVRHGKEITPPLVVRLHSAGKTCDVAWSGAEAVNLEELFARTRSH